MNVVQRETINSKKVNKKSMKDLVRKEFSWGMYDLYEIKYDTHFYSWIFFIINSITQTGIRGGTSLVPNKLIIHNNGPRYQFYNNNVNSNGESTSKPKLSSMGPPLEPLKNLKRK